MLARDRKQFRDNIPGYPGYHVTPDGEVYSTKCRSGERPKPFKMKLRLGSQGYLRVGLWKEGVKKEFRVNRLVALIYVPNPLNNPLVCHKDNNPLNNHYTNLYWGTHQNNMEDLIEYRKNQAIKSDSNILTRGARLTQLHQEMRKLSIVYLYNLGFRRKDLRLALGCGKGIIEDTLKNHKEGLISALERESWVD